VSGSGAAFEIDESLVLDEVVPMIARPFSPGNAFPAGEVAREKMKFDKALIGSCTNGSYDDLLRAALILRALFRLGRRFAQARPGRHHHLQSQLAEPHGYGR
jgi:homoaconitase/3-isopropylmalate dehydratase large subunit